MALRPHHVMIVAVAPTGPGTVGRAMYRYLGHLRPEASISTRQVNADFIPPRAGDCKGEYRFGQAAEDAQCAAIAA